MGDKVHVCPIQLRAIRQQRKRPSVALNQRLDPGLDPEEKSSLLDSLTYRVFLPVLAQPVLCGEQSRGSSRFLATRVGGGALGA